MHASAGEPGGAVLWRYRSRAAVASASPATTQSGASTTLAPGAARQPPPKAASASAASRSRSSRHLRFFLFCGRASPARANFWLGSVNAYRRQRALESGMFAERPRVARRHFFHAETTSNPSCRRSAAGAAVVAGCPSDHLQDPRAPPRPRLPKNVRVLLDIAGRAKL